MDEVHNSSLSFACLRPVEQRCHDAHGAHQPAASEVRQQVDRGHWVLVLPEVENPLDPLVHLGYD